MGKRFDRLIVLFVLLTALVFMLVPTVLADSKDKGDVKVYLKGMKIDAKQSEIPFGLTKNGYLPGEEGPYIITFTGPIEDAYKIEVTGLGAQLVEYIPDFSFLTIMTPEVASMVADLDCVSGVQLYQPAYKIQPTLKDEHGNLQVNKEVVVKIVTFDDDVTQIDNEIINAHGQRLSKGKNHVIAKLYSHQLGSLAQLNSVKFIEVVPEYHLLNDVAKGIMDVDDVWNLGYDGTGQVVAVCDTGLDRGVNDATMHLDFQGRIDAIFALGRTVATDPHGHGTHVAGSVLGSGARSSGQIKGMAPNAHLVFQSILDSTGGLGGIPADLNTLFQQAWDAGARIHTNSWGAAVDGAYNSNAQELDEFVWNNDMIILFAAGNEGSDPAWQNVYYTTICSPGSAKNCITVGGSENYRPTMDWVGEADNPDEVVIFSSRGLTEDGRIKPDIVAPGSWILSTRSSLAPSGNFWGSYNSYYAYMGGTSMSTPLTAGAVAVARQYIQDLWRRTPSPAMMKAVLINGAVDMGYGIPSRDQGWGRVSLYNSLAAKEYRYQDETYSLSTNKNKNLYYDVTSSKTPLKLTLAWTDYPGSITATKALVNDLNLKVTSPSGNVYYGNCSIVYEPFPIMKPVIDHTNNVENILINYPEVGTYTVEVIGYNVPQGPQPFALYVSGDFNTIFDDSFPPICTLTAPANGATVSNTVTLSATAVDTYLINRVEFYVDGVLVGTDTTSPYSYSWDSTTVANGNHVIMAKAFDQRGNVGNSNSSTVNVSNSDTVYVTTVFSGIANAFQPGEHSFLVSAPGSITLSLNQLGLSMKLYNSLGTEVASGTTSIDYLTKATGLYTVRITSLKSISYSLTCTYPTKE